MSYTKTRGELRGTHNTHDGAAYDGWRPGLLKGPIVQDIVIEIELSERGSQTFPLENKLQYVSLYLQSGLQNSLGQRDI